MGDLNLFKTGYKDGAYESVWNISGNQGQNWKRNYLEIKSADPFKVR
jgi:hypothetical protein